MQPDPGVDRDGPSGPAITGLSSISAISGCASTIALIRTRRSSSVPKSTGAVPRYPVRRGKARANGASPHFAGTIGQIRTVTSLSSSAWMPPAPQAITGRTRVLDDPDEELDPGPTIA